jgi:hypothetical protein
MSQGSSSSPETLRREALARIEDAIRAVDRYRAVASRDAKTQQVLQEQRLIEKRASDLLLESYIGASGKPCHCCNGSGRER